MSKLALAGMSFGGSLAPIAASGDDRYSAIIAIDGKFSARQAFEEQFPAQIFKLFNASKVTEFNEVMNEVMTNATVLNSLRWVVGYGYANISPPYEAIC